MCTVDDVDAFLDMSPDDVSVFTVTEIPDGYSEVADDNSSHLVIFYSSSSRKFRSFRIKKLRCILTNLFRICQKKVAQPNIYVCRVHLKIEWVSYLAKQRLHKHKLGPLG